MTNAQKTPVSRKKLIAIIAAVTIIAGTVTLTSVNVARANAEETTRLCDVAVKDGASAMKVAQASTAAADAALLAVKVVELPAAAGTSTDYAARAGAPAVPAVPAAEAVPAVAAVPARPSGADLIGSTTAARAALQKIRTPTTCVDRAQAERITAVATVTAAATKTLDTSVKAVTADFVVFQTEETARIAAEIEAARVAAEAEAARVAAEAEAARAAAEAEAERAAENAADNARSSSGGSGGGSSSGTGGSSGGGGSSSGSAPHSGPPNGGLVGPGGNPGGVCWTSNSMGGSKPCGT